MNIGVNARLLLPGRKEGIARFSTEILRRMVESHPEDQFHFFFDRWHSEDYIFGPNVVPHAIGPQARHPILWRIWFDWQLPKYLKKEQIDVFFSPDGYLSLKTDVPTVMVTHDIAYEHFDDHIKASHLRYLRKQSPKFHERADHILTVSQFVADDIQEQYGVSKDKLTVVGNSTDLFRPSEVSITVTKGRPYFVYVGSLHPRKNIQKLIAAFEQFKEEDNQDTCLVLIGRLAWKSKAIQLAIAQSSYKDNIVHLDSYFGDVSPILSKAIALLYPSLFEGFGIPILEGFACEVPVITSNVTSMPEVAGDAALLVDPNDVNAIQQAMSRIVKDGELSSTLVEKGKARLANYSWQKYADIVYKTLKQAAKS